MLLVTPVTDSTFKQEVLESKIPVLIDFWANWCGSCSLVDPVIDAVAEQYNGQVKVVKVNTDENPSLSSQYDIRRIPTIMLFKDGQQVDVVVGAVPKITLTSGLQKYL